MQIQEDVNSKKILTTKDLDWIDDMMMTMNNSNDN